jgi:hypothetical protein
VQVGPLSVQVHATPGHAWQHQLQLAQLRGHRLQADRSCRQRALRMVNTSTRDHPDYGTAFCCRDAGLAGIEPCDILADRRIRPSATCGLLARRWKPMGSSGRVPGARHHRLAEPAQATGKRRVGRRPMIEIDAAKGPYPLGMPPAKFLREYWQKQPLLIRNAFPGFVSPVQPEDLAGLACEDGVLARLIADRPTIHGARHGPFVETDFNPARPRLTRWCRTWTSGTPTCARCSTGSASCPHGGLTTS